MAPGHPACTALLPKRKLSSAKRATKEELKGRLKRLSAKPASAKVETKPKKAARKGKSADKTVRIKREREVKGKQAK